MLASGSRTSRRGWWNLASQPEAHRLLAESIEGSLGERLVSSRPLEGGSIGEVYRVELADGTLLVAKVDRGGPRREPKLDREAYMLRYLRDWTDLPVPEVYHGSPSLLLMEFVEGESRFSEGAERHAAELLAGLHGITADAYGHERDTLAGHLDQPNPWTASWIGFFRDQRLLYMARTAHEAGQLPAPYLGRVEGLAGRLEEIVGEPNPAALIHGDVWLNNVLARGDRVSAFLDPAIYHADPEIELSFISLFNSFGEAFFERYSELRPIRPGFFEERRHLYALYPLLTHAYYFGGPYVARVDETLRHFE